MGVITWNSYRTFFEVEVPPYDSIYVKGLGIMILGKEQDERQYRPCYRSVGNYPEDRGHT